MLDDEVSHAGGDKNFWQNSRVDNYDSIQTILSEKKSEVQENITRIIKYFCDLRQITHSRILDIGCGPGTPITLSRYIPEKVPECTLVGADGSEEMIAKSKANARTFGKRPSKKQGSAV